VNKWIKGYPYLLSAVLLSACGTMDTSQANKQISAQDTTQVEIAGPLHFSGPDGSDLVVQAGTYQVHRASESELRLVSSTAASPILLSARTTRSTADVSKPVALGALYESEAYHLILLLPGNTALETYGSVSGVQSRGGFGALKGSVFLNAKTLQVQPLSPQPLPDLVPTCGKVFCFGAITGGTTCTLMTGVLNQGTAAAGPSQAKNGAKIQSVPALQPGQLQGLVFGTYYGPPPSTIQADAGSQVVESNEENNTGQVCP
jgi:hypothetical protein